MLMFLTDLNAELKSCLIEEYFNEKKPSDGEIYRKIRQYHFKQDVISEGRWKSRLRGNRMKNFKGLIQHDRLTAAFDALLDVSGLWDGMMITTLHTILAMRCNEVSGY